MPDISREFQEHDFSEGTFDLPSISGTGNALKSRVTAGD
jgi:hypothetical protein